SGMHAIIYGGAPMSTPLLITMTEHLDVPLLTPDGITSTYRVCTGLPEAERVDADTGSDRSESIGRETPLIEIDLVDDEGRVVSSDEVGEIRVTSPAVMRGYLGRPDDTEAVLSGASYLTGDMGPRDEHGYLWL